ncbi:MAG TPA: CBS domain-containing protein [Candidatus Limnocylindria bacterium]
METPEGITQATPVEEVARLVRGTEPILARAGDSLRDLAEAAIANPACRTIAIVDDELRLIGVVSVVELLNDIFVKVVPEEFLGEIADVPAALRYAEKIGARVAADVMAAPHAVHPQDAVRDAFRELHESGLDGLPLIDADRRVIGYLDQLELLVLWTGATGRAGLVEPGQEGWRE